MDDRRIFFSHSIDVAASGDCSRHLAHTFCTAGSCTMLINGMEYTMQAGDLLIVRNIGKVERVLPSEDFAVSVVYASPSSSPSARRRRATMGRRGRWRCTSTP